MNKDDSILENLFSSEVKIDLLVLFHGNPGITDTFEGIALRVGRPGREVRPDLEDFVNLGILKKRTLGKETEVFQVDRSGDKKIQNWLDEYFKSLEKTTKRQSKDFEVGV